VTADILTFDRATRAERAWDRYADLVRAQWAEPALMVDIEHQKQMALAHAAWERLFIAGERGC
jgi:hypothetical protein